MSSPVPILTYQEVHFNRIWKAALPICMPKLLPEPLVLFHERKEQQHLEQQQFMYVLCRYEFVEFTEFLAFLLF